MAEFTNTDIGPIQGNTAIDQPVVDRSSAIMVQANTGLLKGVGDLVGGIMGQIKQGQLDKAVGDFAQSQLAIANAVDQGQISSQEGRLRMRKNFNEAISNNPAMFDTLSKAHKGIVTTSGLGKVVEEGTKAEQAFFAQVDAAHREGFDGPDEDKNLIDYQNWLDAKRNTETQMRDINLQKSKNELDNALLKTKSNNALNEMAAAYAPKVENKINTILQNYNRGGLNQQEAINSLNNVMVEAEQAATVAGSGQNKEFAQQILGPIKKMQEMALKVVTGELDKQVMDNRLANLQTDLKLRLFTRNPRLLAALTIDSMSGGGSIALNALITEEALKGYIDLVGGKPIDLSQMSNEDLQALLQQADQRLTMDNTKGSATQADKTEVATNRDVLGKQVDGLLKTFDTYANTVEEPDKLIQVHRFIADPKFGKWVVGGGTINPDDAVAVRTVYQKFFETQVLPTLQKEFLESGVVSEFKPTAAGLPAPTSEVPTTQLFQPSFDGGSVVFKQVQELAKEPFGTINQQTDLRRTQQRLKQLGQVINETIRFEAHLAGHTNYEKVWNESVKPRLFPEAVEPEGEGSEGKPQSKSPRPIPRPDVEPKRGKAEGGSVTDNVMAALVEIESGGNHQAESSAGARGITQVMPATAADPGFGMKPLDLDNATEKEQIAWSKKYLQAMVKKFGNLTYALVAYNWGPGNAQKWIKEGADIEKLPRETRNYIAKFDAKGVLK